MDVILSYSYPDRYGCYAILFLLSIFLHKENLYTTPCIVPGSRGRSEGTAREDSEWTAAREGAQNGLLLARTQKGLRLARVFEPSPRCLCPFPLLLHFECVRVERSFRTPVHPIRMPALEAFKAPGSQWASMLSTDFSA